MHTDWYEVRGRRHYTLLGIVVACAGGGWLGLVASGTGLEVRTAAQQPRHRPAEQRNMALVGFDDLQARSAYQPLIRRQGDRWIAYIGHHGGVALNPLTGQQESNGTSILDVTNPKQPTYLAHIQGPSGQGESGGAQMVRVCDGSQLPRADKTRVYLLRTAGNTGHEIWDVTDPSSPYDSLSSSADCAAPIRTGGNATPASPTWCLARRAGAPSG